MSAPGREAGTSAEPADPLAPGRPARNQTITDPNLRLLDTDGNTLPLMTGLSQPAPAPAAQPGKSSRLSAIIGAAATVEAKPVEEKAFPPIDAPWSDEEQAGAA